MVIIVFIFSVGCPSKLGCPQSVLQIEIHSSRKTTGFLRPQRFVLELLFLQTDHPVLLGVPSEGHEERSFCTSFSDEHGIQKSDDCFLDKTMYCSC